MKQIIKLGRKIGAKTCVLVSRFLFVSSYWAFNCGKFKITKNNNIHIFAISCSSSSHK